MNDRLDTGDILAKKEFRIDREDAVNTLLDKIVDLAPDYIAEHFGATEQDTAGPVFQNEAKASYTDGRTPKDSVIDCSKSDEGLYNYIRPLTPPYSPALSRAGIRRLVISETRLADGRLWSEGYAGSKSLSELP